VLAACLLAFLGISQVRAAAPTVQQMLQYKPRQDGFAYSTPSPDAEAGCKVDLVKGKAAGSGWQLKDDKGNVLRLFFDTNGDNKIDVWSYYKDGVEVYREIDSTLSAGKPDQYRWINGAGSKWGVDPEHDGHIKSWKVISPEEVSQEILQAVSKNDVARYQALLMTEQDLKSLELPTDTANRIRESVKGVPAKFGEVVAKLNGKIGPKATWIHVELATPQCVPADMAGTRVDVVRHLRGTILYEFNGTSGWLQTGEIIQVGSAWKLTGAPAIGPAEERRPEDGPSLADNPKLMEKIKELEAHDKTAPAGSGDMDTRVAEHHLKRADILEAIIADVKPEEREPWIRQVADSLGTAAQSSPETDKRAMTRLSSLEQQLSKMPGSNLAAYAAYRELQAGYAMSLRNAKDFKDVQSKWAEKLAKFVTTYPKAEDTPDALLQLGMVSEFLDKETEAKNWYGQLAKNFPEKPQAAKAAGAERRLSCEGQLLKLAGPSMNDADRAFDIDQFRGKIVLVYYWASWNTQCATDFAKLRVLLETNKGVDLLCVNLDGKREEARDFMKRQERIPGTHIHSAGGLESKLAIDYGVMVLPHMFLVDREGKVVSRTIQVGNVEEEIKKLNK
jgi:hypothetical protein